MFQKLVRKLWKFKKILKILLKALNFEDHFKKLEETFGKFDKNLPRTSEI